MSVSDLVAAVQGLTTQMDTLHKSMGAVTTALPELSNAMANSGKTAKETADPFAELLKTLDSMYVGKDKWGDMFRGILDQLKEGRIDANAARDALQQMIVKLEQLHDVDALSGTAADMQNLLQQLEKMLQLLDRARRK